MKKTVYIFNKKKIHIKLNINVNKTFIISQQDVKAKQKTN